MKIIQENNSSSIIIFLAYEVGRSELIAFLKSMEKENLQHRLLIVTPPDLFDIFKELKNLCIVNDFRSLDSLIAAIEYLVRERNLTVTDLMAIDEEEQFSISRRIAEHFQLKFYSLKTCAIASNKFLQKTIFAQNNIPTGHFTLISELNEKHINVIGFPNILKVLSGNGSAYLFKNDNLEQLQTHFEILKKSVKDVDSDSRFREQQIDLGEYKIILNPKNQFLLEEYIGGEEYSCDFIVDKGHVRIIRVVKKYRGPFLGFFSGYLLLREEDLAPNHIDLNDLEAICLRITNSFEIESGVCMVDFKMNQGKFKLIESSIRPGLSAFNHLMYEIFGYTSLALMAKQKMGIEIETLFPRENGAIIYLYADKNTILDEPDITSLEQFRSEYNILHIHKFESSGLPVTDNLCDRSGYLIGYVMIKNPNSGQIPELADLFNRNLKFIPRSKKNG